MVGAVTRIFGVHNLALAEDVVQEAFCRATEVWSFRGVPENPSAWLMATAKHCALDVLRREASATRSLISSALFPCARHSATFR
jgi:RNA polymerase sigma-70 factor (ECF subfamily)